MSKPARKNNDLDSNRNLQLLEEREMWQKEFIARQNIIQEQVKHRKEKQRVPKAAWAFMAIWGAVFAFSIILFLMSFNPATKDIVSKIIGAFRVF